jgi:ribonuclease HIII
MKPAVIKVVVSDLKPVEAHVLKSTHASSQKTKGDHESFRILFAGETIVAYTSGKIVCNGPRAEAAVRNAVLSLSSDSTKTEMIIGSDEAGKGEWLGPMVVAAVALTPQQSRLLQSLGVMDSKEIPVERLSELAVEIEHNSSSLNVVLITPKTFNERFAELKEEGKNLNDLLAWGHAKSIGVVYNEVTSDTPIRVVVDEFARKKTEYRLSRVVPLEEIHLTQRPHAEDEIAVAAAAIIAREARERWIDRFSDDNDVDLRDLSVPEAAQRTDKHLFSKVQYLRKMALSKSKSE